MRRVQVLDVTDCVNTPIRYGEFVPKFQKCHVHGYRVCVNYAINQLDVRVVPPTKSPIVRVRLLAYG